MPTRAARVLAKLRAIRGRFLRMAPVDGLDAFLESARGGITRDEARALIKYAGRVDRGCAVEVGSFRGKSAVALAHGLAGKPLYCIEPHEAFIGVRGGVFGPEDRAAFFANMLRMEAYRNTRLINLTSREAVMGWTRPIGMLFIDGDHRYAAVREDFELWTRHVLAGGIIALDDTHRPELGPARLVGELLPSREWVDLERVGKIRFLQKLTPYVPTARPRLDILVVCHEVNSAGGLRRFQRVARCLPNDRMAFVRLSSKPPRNQTCELELLTLEEASAHRWDITMVPGQAFPKETIEQFSGFIDPRFGQRIQHVLNDAHRKSGFLAVNRSFCPHGVVFNNRHWSVEDKTEFLGDRFLTLEGAVDAPLLNRSSHREGSNLHTKWIGGVDRARLRSFWHELVPLLPPGWRLKLMGPLPREPIVGVQYVGELTDGDLPTFFEDLSAVFSPETHAGWANIVAEAMACGVPVVCSHAGTLPFARDLDTALVRSESIVQDWVRALEWIEEDPERIRAITVRAREKISHFDWPSYSERLRGFVQDDGRSHYTMAPEHGFFGKWPSTDRLSGLERLLAEMQGCSVLDLGCAEGVAARACFVHGAHAVHGFERDPSRVAAALQLNPEPLAFFRPASVSPWGAFKQEKALRVAYDVVLYLGLHHHIPARHRREVLLGALRRSRRWFAIRTPRHLWDTDDLHATILAEGFERVDHRIPELRSEGELGIYQRAVDDPRLSRRYLRFVSFPKSGRTWYRYALTQLGLADEITFDHDGFDFNDGAMPPFDFDESKRWCACHRADRVVYLHRDPREVMVSLFHQVTGRFRDFFEYEGNVSHFIREPYFGAHNLARFQRMWNRVVAEGLAVSVSYADAHRDFESAMRKVVDALGLQASADEIRESSKRSAFDKMKQVEAEGAFEKPWLRVRNEAPKVRRGQEGSFRSELSRADQDYLDEVFADLI
ncbi:MAG: class I SAM-dependent methyltransferase [Myxococcota bacterium]